jgi:ectoine hydroxylase-related dioxygenase (phytanoyl-CoA dioxygenase family)
MSTTAHAAMKPSEILDRLHRDGHVVIEDVISQSIVSDLHDRVDSILERERANPVDPGESEVTVEQADLIDYTLWRIHDVEEARLKRRIRHRQATEFDTPFPVDPKSALVSFVHIPTFFDDGRSQRIFNLINKDATFASIIEHPVILEALDQELGADLMLSDTSVNHVGPHTNSAGWHVDTPLTQMPEPLPNVTFSVQTAWMLDDFTADNGATHVVTGSHKTLRKPPTGQPALEGETVLEGPAGSVAMWLSQTWHRHGANVTDAPRNGVIIQYARSWVKPFADFRSSLDAEHAAAFSPRLRYMLGCNATPVVRG